MNTLIARYDVDVSLHRKRWLRDSFAFKTTPIEDESSCKGLFLGSDLASVQEGDLTNAVMVTVTPALMEEIRAHRFKDWETT